MNTINRILKPIAMIVLIPFAVFSSGVDLYAENMIEKRTSASFEDSQKNKGKPLAHNIEKSPLFTTKIAKYHPDSVSSRQIVQSIMLAGIGDVIIPSGSIVSGPPDVDEGDCPDTQSSLPEINVSDPLGTIIQQKYGLTVGGDPVDIYEFVRNNIEYEPYFGSVKGAKRTLLEGCGNDLDIASLLIALLRAKGIPARYEYGTVEVPIEIAKEWTGVNSDTALMSILSKNNNPAQVSGNKLLLDHCWVKAWVNYNPYRAAALAPQEPKYLWVDLDASFKTNNPVDPSNTGIDTATAAFLDSIKAESTRGANSVTDVPNDYIDDEVGNLSTSITDTANEVFGKDTIIPQVFGLLPIRLPYAVLSTQGQMRQLPPDVRYKIEIKLLNSARELILSHEENLAYLQDKRITISYRPQSPTLVEDVRELSTFDAGLIESINLIPELKLDGSTVANGTAQHKIGDEHTAVVIFKAPYAEAEEEYVPIIAGGYYSLVFDVGNMPKEILTSKEITAADLDSLLGSSLDIIGTDYFYMLDTLAKRVAEKKEVSFTKVPSFALVSLKPTIEYLGGVANSASLNKVTIEVPRNIYISVSRSDTYQNEIDLMIDIGILSNVLEYISLKEMLAEEPTATVRLLQEANNTSIPINISENPEEDIVISPDQAISFGAYEPDTPEVIIDPEEGASFYNNESKLHMATLKPADALINTQSLVYEEITNPINECLQTKVPDTYKLETPHTMVSLLCINDWIDINSLTAINGNAACEFIASILVCLGPIEYSASQPLVYNVEVYNRYFSPNTETGNSPSTTTTVNFKVTNYANWFVNIKDGTTIVKEYAGTTGTTTDASVTWDGTQEEGNILLPDGTYTVEIWAQKDTITSEIKEEEVYSDSTPPTAIIDVPRDVFIAQDGLYAITGTATDINIETYTLKLINESVTPADAILLGIYADNVEADVLHLWNFVLPPEPEQGSYNLELVVTDKAGNESSSIPPPNIIWIGEPVVDTTPPTVDIEITSHTPPFDNVQGDVVIRINASDTGGSGLWGALLYVTWPTHPSGAEGQIIESFQGPAPYEYTYPSASFADDDYTFYAVAYDNNANNAESNRITITTHNHINLLHYQFTPADRHITPDPDPLDGNLPTLPTSWTFEGELDAIAAWTMAIGYDEANIFRTYSGNGNLINVEWDGKDSNNEFLESGVYNVYLYLGSTGGRLLLWAQSQVDLVTPGQAPEVDIQYPIWNNFIPHKGDPNVNPIDPTEPPLPVPIDDPFRVPIIGGVTDNDGDLESYTLQYRLHGTQNWTPITVDPADIPVRDANNNIPEDSILGYLDTTVLMNDTYDIGIEAQDTEGSISHTVYVKCMVDSESLKIGNLKFTTEDISFEMLGIPIQVLRSYNSFDKRKGDFGYGWTLEIYDVAIREDDNHNITITLPDGTRAFFPFIPRPLGGYPDEFDNPRDIFADLRAMLTTIYGETYATANYISMPGSGYTLDFEGEHDLMKIGEDNTGLPVFALYPSAEPFNPEMYTLADRKGVEYTINKYQGLQRVTFPNGQVLVYQNNDIWLDKDGNGIYDPATERGIKITRNASDLITKIEDPVGNFVTYEYNANNDLISFTNEEGYSIQYEYYAEYLHYLKKVIDPRGITSAIQEYDDKGRLIAIIDANGNRVSYEHSVDGRQEIVYSKNDPMHEHPTIFTYNEKGQVTSITDPLGNTLYKEYDEEGNIISITNPLGAVTQYSYEYDSLGNINSKIITDTLGNTATYTYNNKGYIASVQDTIGNVTTYEYDEEGNKTAESYPNGDRLEYLYTSYGQLSEMRLNGRPISNITYNASGDPITIMGKDGREVHYSRDGMGRETGRSWQEVLPGGTVENHSMNLALDRTGKVTHAVKDGANTMDFQYSPIGKADSVNDSEGHQMNISFDAMGRHRDVIIRDNGTSEEVNINLTYDEEGNITQNTNTLTSTVREYDILNRLVKETYQDGTYISHAYDAVGRKIEERNRKGLITYYEYDLAGRNIRQENSLGEVTTFAYDNLNNVTSMTDARGNVTYYEYDSLNRLIRTTFADGTTTESSYDTQGNIISQIDQNGIEIRHEYDQRGNLIKVIQPDPETGFHTPGRTLVTTYEYNVSNKKIGQIDAIGNRTSFTYDTNNNLTEYRLPSNFVKNFDYNIENELISILDFNGNAIQYETIENPNSTFTFKEIFNSILQKETLLGTGGEKESVTTTQGTTSFTYNVKRLVESITYPNGQYVNYTYTPEGKLETITTLHGSMSYEYDIFDRLIKVTDGDGNVTEYTYDTVGNRASIIYANGIVTEYTYDSLNRLTDIRHKKGIQELRHYHYVIGNAGEKLRLEESPSERTVDYTYDKLYRLIEEEIHDLQYGDETITYSYDDAGNRLTKTDRNGITRYMYDADDRLVREDTPFGTINYTYDNNGNLTSKQGPSETINYEYDYENRLTKILTSLHTIEYVYTADGIRTASIIDGVITNYLISPMQTYAQVIEETDVSGNLTAFYTYGDDLISIKRGIDTYYYLYDGTMSVRLLTDQSGNIVNEYTYDAFGNILYSNATIDNNYLFSGEQYDPNAEFYYLRARFYNPKTGVFITRDTFEGIDRDPRSLHKYTYCHNDPVNNTDPSGNFTLSEMWSVIKIIGIVAITGLVSYSEFKARAAAGDPLVYCLLWAAVVGVVVAITFLVVWWIALILCVGLIAYSLIRGDITWKELAVMGLVQVLLMVFTYAIFRVVRVWRTTGPTTPTAARALAKVNEYYCDTPHILQAMDDIALQELKACGFSVENLGGVRPGGLGVRVIENEMQLARMEQGFLESGLFLEGKYTAREIEKTMSRLLIKHGGDWEKVMDELYGISAHLGFDGVMHVPENAAKVYFGNPYQASSLVRSPGTTTYINEPKYAALFAFVERGGPARAYYPELLGYEGIAIHGSEIQLMQVLDLRTGNLRLLYP